MSKLIFLVCLIAQIMLYSMVALAQPSSPQLQVISWNCVVDDHYHHIRVRGEAKNLSAAPLTRLAVSATFRDQKGTFISNTGKVFLEYRPLMPGQISPFEVGGDYNPLIWSAQLLFSGGETPLQEQPVMFAGIPTARCIHRAE